jgi:hypothetical protein
VRALFVGVCAAFLLASTASAAPEQTPARLANYCSPSGDVCYGIFNDRGRFIRFQLTLAARYFGR